MTNSRLIWAIGISVVMLAGIASVGSAALAPVKNASFEAPVTAGLTWGPITDWDNDDRFGTGNSAGVMLASDQNRLPLGAPDGLQVAAVRECWFRQLVTRPEGSWVGSEPNKKFTLSAYLGIDTISPTQGLHPRTLIFGIYAIPDVNDWLVKVDLDLSGLTPGTMQYVTMSFATTPGSGIPDQGMYIGLYQTEANSLTLIDDVQLDIVPIPEPTSLMTLGLGLAGLVGAWRKRK